MCEYTRFGGSVLLTIKQYVRAESLEQAYELNQKKSNLILGGMHWMKMTTRTVGTAIDLSGLGLGEIVETDDRFEIGCMVTLRQLEQHPGLTAYTHNAVAHAVKDIVGVQFRNTATVGGSIFGRYGFSDVLTVFLALDTTVVCHHAGEISLEKYAAMAQDRDILVKLVVKKVPLQVSYQAMRHARTDFPILTCAVSQVDGVWQVSVGARPYKASLVRDQEGLLAQGVDVQSAQKFGDYVSQALNFGSNMRGSAQYRRQICSVLVQRAAKAASEVK